MPRKFDSKMTVIAHCEMSQRVQRNARKALRKNLAECPDWKRSNLDADVILEQVWNAMVDWAPEPPKRRARGHG